MHAEDLRRAAATQPMAALRDSRQRSHELHRELLPRGSHQKHGLGTHAHRIRKERKAQKQDLDVGGRADSRGKSPLDAQQHRFHDVPRDLRRAFRSWDQQLGDLRAQRSRVRVFRERWRENESGDRAEFASSHRVAADHSKSGAVRGPKPRDSHGEAVRHSGGGGVDGCDLSFFLRTDDSAAHRFVSAAVQPERGFSERI